MEAILSFYYKARAFKQSLMFLDGCAQTYIDEHSDYQKAHDTLKEALNYVEKIKDNTSLNFISEMKQKLNTIKEFLEIKKCSNSTQVQKVCEDLLKDGAKVIKAGDCYRLMVFSFVKEEKYADANNLLKEMKLKGIDPEVFISKRVIEKILYLHPQNLSVEEECYDNENESISSFEIGSNESQNHELFTQN